MNKWILVGVLCLFVGCVKHTDSFKCQEIFFDEDAEMRNATPSYEFIPLETGPDNLLGDITQIEIAGDRIFILDENSSRSIQVYNTEGKFIALIGRIGNGPGEYVTPMNFYIDKVSETILVNGGTHKFLVYDLNTYQYLFSKETPKFNVWSPLSDGNYAWWKFMGYKKDGESYSILITDSLLHEIKYCHSFDYNIYGDVMFTRDVFYKLKDKTYFYKAHNPVVYEITSNGEKPAYKVRLGHHPFPPLEYLLSLSDGRKLLQTDYITCYQLFDTESYLLVRYMVGQKRYVGLYDKKGKKTCRYADFHNDDTIFNTASYVGVTEDNRFILSLSAEPLKRRYIQPDDLRALAKNISAEDNPILCLVKFK